MAKQTLQEEIKDLLMGDDDLLMQVVSDLNSWDGSYDNLQFYENDEEFFNMFFEGNPMEAVRATCFGEYNYNDDFVKFNGYGNLESMDKYQVVEEMQDEIDSIIEDYIDKQSHLCVSEVDDIIDNYEEEDEEEEE